jgi:hypothetical protein
MVEDTTKLEFQYHQTIQTAALFAEEKAAQIKAVNESKIRTVKAETKLKIAELEGEATKCMAAAEENSNNYLEKAREMQLVDKRLDVYQALARNANTVLLGDESKESKDYNSMLLADSVLHQTGDVEDESTSSRHHGKLVNQLNMLRIATAAYGMRQEESLYYDKKTL